MWRQKLKTLNQFVVFWMNVTIKLQQYNLSFSDHVQKQTIEFKDKENAIDHSIISKRILNVYSTTLSNSWKVSTSLINLFKISFDALSLFNNSSQKLLYIRTWAVAEKHNKALNFTSALTLSKSNSAQNTYINSYKLSDFHYQKTFIF